MFNLMPTVPAVPYEKPVPSTSTSCLCSVVSRTSVGIVSLLYNTVILSCIYYDFVYIVHRCRDDILYGHIVKLATVWTVYIKFRSVVAFLRCSEAFHWALS